MMVATVFYKMTDERWFREQGERKKWEGTASGYIIVPFLEQKCDQVVDNVIECKNWNFLFG